MTRSAGEALPELAVVDERDEIQHLAAKRWPHVKSHTYGVFLSRVSRVMGGVVEIGSGFGLHVLASTSNFTGVDYGYFVEAARRLHPERRWRKLDFDRYDLELFARLAEPGVTYVVRERVEHVRDPVLLLAALLELTRQGSAVVIAHQIDRGDPLAPFYRRRVNASDVQTALAPWVAATEVVGELPAPERGRLALVAAGSHEQLTKIGDACREALTVGEGRDDLDGRLLVPSDRDLSPESMLVTPDMELLTRRAAESGVTVGKEVDSRAVFERLLAAKDQQAPFSLLRLGNGEARVLGFPDFVAPIWLGRSMRNWFGTRTPELHIRALQDELSEVLREADVVGAKRGRYRDPQYALPLHLLQEYGLAQPETLLCSPDIHLHALRTGFLAELLGGEDGVTLVGPHDMANGVSRAFGVGDVRWCQVPGQAKFFFDAEQAPHFPVVFEELRESLAPRWGGEIFLVGAGLLGKIYCGWIRRRGGIAFDIGSVFDLWAGKQTRGRGRDVDVEEFRLG